jgi:hypothetical protein
MFQLRRSAICYHRAMPSPRRFPPPWSIAEGAAALGVLALPPSWTAPVCAGFGFLVRRLAFVLLPQRAGLLLCRKPPIRRVAAVSRHSHEQSRVKRPRPQRSRASLPSRQVEVLHEIIAAARYLFDRVQLAPGCDLKGFEANLNKMEKFCYDEKNFSLPRRRAGAGCREIAPPGKLGRG